MSDYLIKQLEATSNIEVRLGTRVVDARGEARLQALLLEDLRTRTQYEVAAAAVFVLIGAEPRTDWLRNVVELDDHGFVLTGRDMPEHAWPLQRAPLAKDRLPWARSTNTWPNWRRSFHSGNESRCTSARSLRRHGTVHPMLTA